MTTRTAHTSYKPTGIDWIGNIPSHWELRPNKYLFRPRRELVGDQSAEFTLLSLTLRGVIKRDMENPEGKFPESFNSYQEVRQGDFIFCLFDVEETPRCVGLSSFNGMITGAYDVLEPIANVERRYLYWLYLSLDSRKALRQLYKGLRNTIQLPRFLSVPSPLPPLDEQRTIADYLDRKDAQITRFIESRRRMIALLEEKKQAIINQAVTRGLDPTVPMKDSGVEWLGEIPAHWDTVKLGRIVTAASGGTPPMSNIEYWGGNVPWVSPKDMKAKSLSDSKIRITEAAKDSGRVGIAPKGALLIVVRSGILRHSIPTALADKQLTFNQDIKSLTGNDDLVDMRWLQRLFEGNTSELLEKWRKQVATVESIELPWMMATVMPLPQLHEQVAITEYLEQVDRKSERLQIRYKREIELMQEYRTRLVSDVVTGKVRVS